MERMEYLPLGSIVLLNKGTKKLMIIARGLVVDMNGEITFFDYGGVKYPEGLQSEEIAYFNQDGIAEIVHKGYSDGSDEVIIDNINNFLRENNLKKGDPQGINETKGRSV
jgi:Uncharacterized protein conserved in bacteria